MSSIRRSVCPISCALDLLGDKWTLLVIRDMVFVGKRHFKDFQASGEGIASNILSDRLSRLETQKIIRKSPDPESGRQVIYTLTEKGLALIPILVDLLYWGGRYDQGAEVIKGIYKRIERDRQGLIDELVQSCQT